MNQESIRRPVMAGMPGETLDFDSLTQAAKWLYERLHDGEKGTPRQIAGLEGNIHQAATKSTTGISHGVEWILI